MTNPSNPKEEIDLLTEAIHANPDSSKLSSLYIRRGDCHSKLKKHSEAVRDYLEAVDTAESDDEVIHVKALISLTFLQLDNQEHGLWWACAAVELDRENAEGQYVLGLNYSISGFFALAIEALEKTIELTPDNWPAHLLLGKCLREECRLPESLEVLTKYVDANPTDANALYELGWTTHVSLQITDRIPLAIALYERALECAPTPSLRRMIERKQSSLVD